MFFARTLAAALLAFVAGTLSANDQVLRLAPVPGTDYHFVIDQSQDMTLDLGALGTQKMKNLSRLEMTLRALSRADDGTSVLGMGIDRVAMHATQGESTMFALDTDKMENAEGTEGEDIANAMKRFMNADLEVSFSPLGAVEGVSGLESIWQAIAEQLGDDPQKQQLIGVLEQGLSEDSMTQQMGATFPVFPEGPVGKGTSWHHESVTANPIVGEILMSSTYTAGDQKTVDDHSCLELAVETAVEMKGTSDMVEQLKQMMGADVVVGFDELASTGTVCIDRATGLAIDSDMSQKMVMTLSVDRPEDGAESMSMRLSLDGFVKMKQVAAKTASE